MAKDPTCEHIYTVAERFVEAALRNDDSLFTPGRPVWTTEHLGELEAKFVRRPDGSSDTFEAKLRRQLSDATPEAIQLFGEIYYLHLLIPSNIRGETKRRRLATVLGWAPEPVALPADLAEALDRGLLHAGVAYNTYRPFQLQFLIGFAHAWKALGGEEQAKLLEDPWACKGFLAEVPIDRACIQREALLHLLHPDTFEDIASRDAKERIARHFSDLVDETTPDVDRRLLQIRRRLAEKHGAGFGFYDPPLLHRWQPDPSKWGQFIALAARYYRREDFDEQERDYKLRVAENLAAVKEALLAGEEWLGALEKAFGPPNNLTAWRGHDRLLDWCAGEPEAARAALEELWGPSRPVAERLRAFLDRLPREAVSGLGTRTSLASFLLLAVDPENLPFYKATAFQRGFKLTDSPPPAKDADEAGVYQHAVAFLDRFAEEGSKRGLELRDRLDAQGLLWWVVTGDPDEAFPPGEEREAYREFLAGAGGVRGGEDDDEDGGEEGRPKPPATLGELAEGLLFDPAVLEGIDRLLRSKRQVIFHGPPGTGKTYVARQLAEYYAGGRSRVELVQFHPSYAYEDFVEGYRPSGDGRPGFKLRPGPLKRLASEAAAEKNALFVLVIDEINRGNLAKVFGELYFLLEYREEEISLQYSEDRFQLPPNLWVIGTMNTADRSIALVDSALRRRFHFVPFFPDRPPVAGLLGRWLAKHKPDLAWVAAVVERANERLGERHQAIGPSYFLRDDLDEGWVELIWRHSVLPYLEEQFFGEPERLEEFSLDRLRTEAGGRGAAPSTASEDPETGESDATADAD